MIFLYRKQLVLNICISREQCFLYPATQKVAGYYVIPSELWVSVRRPSIRPSVRPSALRFRALTLVAFELFFQTLRRHWYRRGVVWDCKWANFVLKQQSYGPWCMSKILCASFPCSNFITFLPIFFKLCIDIGIGQEWYEIASGIISFRNNRVMALDLCPKCILVNTLRMNRRISIKFCICTDIGIGEEWYGIASGIISFRNNIVMSLESYPKCIFAQYLKNESTNFNKILHMHWYIYLIYIYSITFCFSLFFNRVTALDLCTKCVSPKYLPDKWLHFEKILLVLLSKFKMHTKSECS